jgi:predicted dehydrogenase
MTKTLKVGVIGTGGIVNTHMPGWAASGITEVVAGSDVSEEAMKKWGERYGITRLSTKAEDLINDPDIDIIDICTPNNYHAPLAIAAMKAGKHVICEKPLAPNPQAIRDMIAARDESGKLLMTAQHQRFRGISKALKKEIDAGALGDVYHARGWMLRRSALLPRPGFVYKRHSGGGACIDIGVHILDLTLWFMGNPNPIAVSGVSRSELAYHKGAFSVWSADPIPADMDVEEFAAAFVRFDNGATLILEVSWILHHNTPSEDMQMWLYGTNGGSHWPKCEIYSTNYETQQHYNRTLQITRDINEAHAQECIEFAQAVASGAPSPVPAEQSLQVQMILDGIYRSQDSGKEVRLA